MSLERILLINPLNPSFRGGFLPPLGLTTNASYIPDEYDVRLIDENIEKMNYDADLAAISANSITIRRSYELCKEFTKREIPVLLGGIHPSLVPEESSKYATSVVIGNGENAWEGILKDFEKGDLKKIYKPELFDLAKSKVPNRSLLKNKYFFDSLETARGCPFNCEFCSVTRLHGSTYRYKPLEIVKKDLNSITKKNILIVDDNFLGVGKKSEERTSELLRLLKEYDIRWFGQTSINIADNTQLLKLARESGAMAFFIGFESLNEDFLKSSNKAINLKKGVSSYKEVVKKIHDYGITIMGSFVYGTDYDTKESLLKLKEFVSQAGIDSAHIIPFTPLPGTRLYDRIRKEGRLFNNTYWLENPYPIFTFKPKNLTLDQLWEITLEFHNELKPSKSIERFIKSLWLTKNLKGSLLNLTRNVSEYYTVKNHPLFKRKQENKD